jgi:hypothetical protein
VDAWVVSRIEVPVTLRNEGSRAVTLRFRPETLRFEVTSAAGIVDCPWPAPLTAPTRELYTTLPAGGAATLEVLLGAYCGGHTFDAPGLFVVRPRLDMRGGSGDVLGIRTFDGVVVATHPTLLRLHAGVGVQPLQKPELAP